MANTKITVANMAANSIDSDQYVDGSIDTAHIADDAVTSAKLDTNIAIAGTLGVTGISIGGTEIVTSARAITNITNLVVDNLDFGGSAITVSSGDFTIDSPADIILDADGGAVFLTDADVTYAKFSNSSSSLQIYTPVANKDILFKGNDSGTTVTALTLDMSEAGTATFNHDIQMSDLSFLRMGAGGDLIAYSDGTHALINANNGNLSFDVAGDMIIDVDGGDIYLNDGGTGRGQISMANTDLTIISATSDRDLIFKGVDGASVITALTLDMSEAGAATFNSSVTSTALTTTGGITAFSNFVIASDSGGVYLGKDNNSSLRLITNNTTRLTIDNTGKVGIGRADPTQLLEVHKNTGGDQTVAKFSAHNYSDTGKTYIELGTEYGDGSSRIGSFNDTGNKSVLIFETHSATSGQFTEHMRIKSDGQITTQGDILPGADVIMANGRGISFALSGNEGGMSSELLDDYEEGTFDPTLTTTGGSVTMYTSYNTLAYTKVGRVVTITGMLALTSVSSPTGELYFGNLPFAMASLTNKAGQTRPSIHIFAGGSGAPGQGQYFPAFISFNEGGTSGLMVATYASASDTTIANWFAGGSDIFVNFSYITA